MHIYMVKNLPVTWKNSHCLMMGVPPDGDHRCNVCLSELSMYWRWELQEVLRVFFSRSFRYAVIDTGIHFFSKKLNDKKILKTNARAFSLEKGHFNRIHKYF